VFRTDEGEGREGQRRERERENKGVSPCVNGNIRRDLENAEWNRDKSAIYLTVVEWPRSE